MPVILVSRAVLAGCWGLEVAFFLRRGGRSFMVNEAFGLEDEWMLAISAGWIDGWCSAELRFWRKLGT